MINIGHFVSFGIGGADRASLELVKQLKKRYPSLKICYGDMSFPMRTSDQDPTQDLLSVYEEFCSVGELFKIESASQLNDLDLDILHTHRSGEDGWLIPGLSELKRNFKVVETNFHGYLETPADFRIYPSAELLNFRKIKPGFANAVIPNVVNVYTGKSLRKKLGISEETVVFGRVGRSDRSIYSSTLLKSYSRIEDERTVLLWVGSSMQAKEDARSLGINRIIWVDPVNDPVVMADHYATFDVYCHANPLGETFGNTVAEAVLRGIPVASLKGSRSYPQAQKELIGDEQFCSRSRNFSKLLKKYKDNLEFRELIAHKNLKYAELNLDTDVIVNKIIEVYETVMS